MIDTKSFSPNILDLLLTRIIQDSVLTGIVLVHVRVTLRCLNVHSKFRTTFTTVDIPMHQGATTREVMSNLPKRFYSMLSLPHLEFVTHYVLLPRFCAITIDSHITD